MINDNFIQSLCDAAVGTAIFVPSHLAFGSTTGTLTANDVITSGEFDRNALTTIERIGTNTMKYTCLRSGTEVSTSSGQIINVIGLMASSVGGSLWANTLIASMLHTTDFDADFELSFTINRA